MTDADNQLAYLKKHLYINEMCGIKWDMTRSEAVSSRAEMQAKEMLEAMRKNPDSDLARKARSTLEMRGLVES